MGKHYTHWQINNDENNITWLTLDRQARSVNSLGTPVLKELDSIIEDLAIQQSSGLIITSGKKSGFIAGADVEEFANYSDPNDADKLIQYGQTIFNKIEALNIPTVALINGFCLGGGLELALACDYRIALENPKTRIGLPEVLLGIHPGWGGSVRLARLIGSINMMDLALSGRTVSAKAAEKLGFIDAAVPERQLANAARYYITNKPSKRKASWLQTLTNTSLARKLLAKLFRKKLAAKIQQTHYPAPYALVDCWERFGVGSKQSLQEEANSLMNIAKTQTAKNLARVFFLREKLKNLAKASDFKAKRVHVIGAGTMGGDIAAWCALHDIHVTLQDNNPEMIAKTIQRAYKLFKMKLKKNHLVTAAMDRLMPDIEGLGLAQADVIIEAVFEDLHVKKALFEHIESEAKTSAILATNTSSIPLEEIATVLAKPERLIGIHFFNPVAKMQLVEIIKGEQSNEAILLNAQSFVGQINRLPLPVKSNPGFLVNRVLMPYLIEGLIILEEGVPAIVIDEAATHFGMPMGPVELADTVGLDICLSVAKNLGSHYNISVPTRLEQLVDAGHLGRKTSQGFYAYNNKGKIKGKSINLQDYSLKNIGDRLINKLLLETIQCLEEEIVESIDLADAGVIYATGFAPFRGGPINYAQTLSAPIIKSALQKIEPPQKLTVIKNEHLDDNITEEELLASGGKDHE